MPYTLEQELLIKAHRIYSWLEQEEARIASQRRGVANLIMGIENGQKCSLDMIAEILEMDKRLPVNFTLSEPYSAGSMTVDWDKVFKLDN